MQKYGSIIRKERERNQMSPEVLANILLITPEELLAVESGEQEISQVRLNICANIFDISKEAMILGIRRNAISDEEIRNQLRSLSAHLMDKKPMPEELEEGVEPDVNIHKVI